MKTPMLVVLVLLGVVIHVSGAAAQLSAPAPTAPNSQGLPWWFVKHRYTPGMPWFYRAPGAPAGRQCRVAYWYPAQFSSTDQWGNTVTWVSYAPQYVCD
jgi:hypothetical protein